MGTRGARETVGLPGTGASYTAIQGQRRRPTVKHGSALLGLLGLYVIGYMLLHALGLVQ